LNNGNVQVRYLLPDKLPDKQKELPKLKDKNPGNAAVNAPGNAFTVIVKDLIPVGMGMFAFESPRAIGEEGLDWMEDFVTDPQNSGLIQLPTRGPAIQFPPFFGISFEDSYRCGVNPITGEHGFSQNPTGVPGNLRPGVGGGGQFHARRRGDPIGHQGFDISGITGQSPVYANRDGRVTFAGATAGMAGNLVIIDHGGGVTTRYAHLDSFASGLVTGSIVSEGQQVGIVGQTGNARNLPASKLMSISAFR
jgi:murein DD-endopeptidase MepM/ murein hydrolase activator NlpD